ncbi:MAG: hypothetical protein AB1921_01105 [Thermodesulfobacteriota bacterium]
MANPDDTGRDTTDRGQPAFRLGQAPSEDRSAEQPVEDLRRTVFRLFVCAAVLLVLAAAAVVFLYLSLNRRITALSESGAGKLERLSTELAENFERLSKTVKEMQAAREKNEAEFSSRFAEANKAQKKISEELAAVRNAKIGPEEAKKLAEAADAEAAARIEKDVAARLAALDKLDKSVADLAAQIGRVAQESAQAKRSLADVIEGQMSVSERSEALKKSVDALSKAKADTAFVEKLLADQKTFYKSQMARSDKDLEQRLSALETQIVSYESELERLRQILPQPGGR